MSDHDPALVGKVAFILASKGVKGERDPWPDEIARAVLDAVADDLRAEGWDRRAAMSPLHYNNPFREVVA